MPPRFLRKSLVFLHGRESHQRQKKQHDPLEWVSAMSASAAIAASAPCWNLIAGMGSSCQLDKELHIRILSAKQKHFPAEVKQSPL